jgi:glucose-6-phosphate isomerase
MPRRATTGSHVLGREDQHQERRAVLHVALRAPRGARIELDGVDVAPDVHRVLDAMADFATRLRGGAFTGKRLRNVVNIGIGGSYLGPEMAYRALRVFSERSMTFRFVVSFCGRRAWREPPVPLHPVSQMKNASVGIQST